MRSALQISLDLIASNKTPGDIHTRYHDDLVCSDLQGSGLEKEENEND